MNYNALEDERLFVNNKVTFVVVSRLDWIEDNAQRKITQWNVIRYHWRLKKFWYLGRTLCFLPSIWCNWGIRYNGSIYNLAGIKRFLFKELKSCFSNLAEVNSRYLKYINQIAEKNMIISKRRLYTFALWMLEAENSITQKLRETSARCLARKFAWFLEIFSSALEPSA